MDRELRRLRSRIAAAPKDGQGHRRFGVELRADVLSFARARISSGATQSEVAAELGVGARVLWGWLRRDESLLLEVVIDTEPSATQSRSFRITLRSGAEIIGLELDDVIAIARALS